MSYNHEKFVFEDVALEENGVRVQDHEGTWNFDETSLAPLWKIFCAQVLPYFTDSWNVDKTIDAFTLILTLNPLERSVEAQQSLATAINTFRVAVDRSVNGTGLFPDPNVGALSHHLSPTGHDSGQIMAKASLEYALGNVVQHLFTEAYELNSYLHWVIRLHDSQDNYRRTSAPAAANAIAIIATALLRTIRVSKLMTVFGTPPDRTPNYHDFSWRDVAREEDTTVTDKIKNLFPHLLDIIDALRAAAILEGLVQYYDSRMGLKSVLIADLMQSGWAARLDAGFNIDGAAQMIGLE